MFTPRQATLVDQALSEIDQLLNNFDPVGQIEVALPLIRRHRRTLAQLRHSRSSPKAHKSCQDRERWIDDIATAFRHFGGRAAHRVLYRTVEQIRKSAGRSWPHNAHETIRQTLQAHNAESPQYRGGPDIFRMVRPGLWRLKEHSMH